MQIVQLSNKLKPLTLAAGLLSATASFGYSDFDEYSGILSTISNSRTSEYIKFVDNNDIAFISHKFRFQNHLRRWEIHKRFLSSTKSIVENKDFLAIVSMGYSAVPFIVDEIESKPSSLVWALNLIFDKKITNNPSATISDACKLWVRELKK